MTTATCPAFTPHDMVVTGSVLLSRLTATATIEIPGAQITGQLSCIGAILNGQTGPRLGDTP